MILCRPRTGGGTTAGSKGLSLPRRGFFGLAAVVLLLSLTQLVLAEGGEPDILRRRSSVVLRSFEEKGVRWELTAQPLEQCLRLEASSISSGRALGASEVCKFNGVEFTRSGVKVAARSPRTETFLVNAAAIDLSRHEPEAQLHSVVYGLVSCDCEVRGLAAAGSTLVEDRPRNSTFLLHSHGPFSMDRVEAIDDKGRALATYVFPPEALKVLSGQAADGD